MKVYLTYAQTPELQSLATAAERDAVHSAAWARLRKRRPELRVRSFALVVICAALGCLFGIVVNEVLTSFAFTTTLPLAWAAGLGGGAAGLMHIHRMATSLRPIYAEIIANSNDSAQGDLASE